VKTKEYETKEVLKTVVRLSTGCEASVLIPVHCEHVEYGMLVILVL